MQPARRTNCRNFYFCLGTAVECGAFLGRGFEREKGAPITAPTYAQDVTTLQKVSCASVEKRVLHGQARRDAQRKLIRQFQMAQSPRHRCIGHNKLGFDFHSAAGVFPNHGAPYFGLLHLSRWNSFFFSISTCEVDTSSSLFGSRSWTL